MNSPIAICGCPGSGTSLVAKILRHAGLFLGADAGPADARKYHESQCFKRCNMQFLDHTIEFSHAPKSVEQFQTHNSKMNRQHAQLVELVDRDQLLSEYRGDFESQSSAQAWGWKDPRNSATAMIWQNVFPELRVIVVCRNWRWRDRWKSRGSESGNWYRKQSTAELRKLYENPIGIEQNALLRVDVDQLTTDVQVLEQVLKWCSLNVDPVHAFDEFMNEIGLER